MGIVSSLCESNTAEAPAAASSNLNQTYALNKNALETIGKVKPHQSTKVLSIEDFRVIQILGKGSFGKVYLVEHRIKHKYYALKCFKKDNILLKNLLERVLSEKDILKKLKHPFVVGLKYAFQNKTKVYLAMDLCQGGDLNTQLQQKKKFDEEGVRFYASEVILALQYIHENLDVIHRDIKPENIMFCADGHIKLADFGIAKETKKTFSLCGTPEYVAPEIIMGEGYGKEVDWWGLGCLLFEMLTGLSPFMCKDRQQMPLKILTNQPEMPGNLSEDIKDLILKLLVKEPKKRLGTNGAKEIKEHSFFKNVDWKRALDRKTTPPFVPNLTSKEDTRYFPEASGQKTMTANTAETTTDKSHKKNQPSAVDFPAFSYVDAESVMGSFNAASKVHTRNPSEIVDANQAKEKF